MKKFLVLMLALTLTFALVACEEEEEEEGKNGNDEERTAPEIEGTDDVTIYIDSEFDPMEGVTATDHDGDDITDDITISGSVDTSKTGSNYLKYSVEDEEGLSSESNRYVTVEVDPENVDQEMVRNGDFSLGEEFWKLTTGNEGGEGSIEAVDEELKVSIEAVTWNGTWEPRLENSGITFEKDKAYEVAFDARADDVRSINVQVGEILDDAPWFIDFKLGQSEIHELSTEMETYSFQFMMSEDTSDNGSLLFEMGDFEDDEEDNLTTNIYYDNIMIEEIDEDDFEDEIAPAITGADDMTIEVGTDFDPLEGVSVTDNVDGDITLDSDHVTGTVDTDEAGEYELTYTVSDEAGNETEHKRTVTVEETSEEETLYEEDFGWRTFVDGAIVDDSDLSVVDGELVAEFKETSPDAQNYQLQIIQDAFAMDGDTDNEGSIEYEAGESYRVSFDAKATVEGDFTFATGAGLDGWAGYADETFSVTSDMQTFEYEFTLDSEGDYSDPAQFKLELGGLFAGESGTESFTLDNVVIEVKNDNDEYEDAELITNGDFVAEGALQNGDFSSGMDHWTTTTGDGGEGSFEVTDGEMEIDITAVDAAAGHSPRLENKALGFENGKTYEVSFDAYADDDRTIRVQVGELLDEAPYFVDFKDGQDVDSDFDITDTKTGYSFEFEMTEATNKNGAITFEFGEFEDVSGTLLTTVYLDNVSISEVSED